MSTPAEEYFKVYEEHSKTLRTWFVAYGIGAPVLVVGNTSLWTAVTQSNRAGAIAWLFLGGVVLQVALTVLNKHTMWGCYYGEAVPTFKQSRAHRVSNWMSERYAIDIVVDFISLFLFIAGTTVLLTSASAAESRTTTASPIETVQSPARPTPMPPSNAIPAPPQDR